jgi:hypothetical protein
MFFTGDNALDGSQLRVDDEGELCTIPRAIYEDSDSQDEYRLFAHDDTQPVPDHPDMDRIPATQSQVDLTQRVIPPPVVEEDQQYQD